MSKHNDLPIRGAVVAITGGARGIGRATALEFLKQGGRVAIGDVDAAMVEQAAAELGEQTGNEVLGLHLDVTDRKSFAAFVATTGDRLGPMSVLVNNAGIMPTGPFAEESPEMTDRLVDINLHGVLTGSRLALEAFADRPGTPGHIVNLASLAGVSGFAGLATYCATKHAVLGFTEALNREQHGTGIGVTAVLPGAVNTELSAGNSIPDWIRPVAEVEPEDVARAIVAVIGTTKTQVTVPRALGAMLTMMSLVPDAPRQSIQRAAKFDTAFSHMDANARAAYERRAAGEQ